MGACPVVMQVKRAHNELVNPMMGSYELPLAYIGLMTICFLSSKLRSYSGKIQHLWKVLWQAQDAEIGASLAEATYTY